MMAILTDDAPEADWTNHKFIALMLTVVNLLFLVAVVLQSDVVPPAVCSFPLQNLRQ